MNERNKSFLNTLYLDCSSGISGDMTVAALLDLGADQNGLLSALASLPLDGYEIRISRVKKSGIDACDFNVVLDEDHDNHDHDMAYLHGDMHPELHHEHGHDHPEHHHDHEHDHAEHHHDHEHDHSEHHHDHEHHDHHGHDHHGHDHHSRNLDDIRQILYSGALNDRALEIAVRIFEIVAEAEAKVHGMDIEEVHFHEVGAVDSIIDIAAIAFCIDDLNIGQVIIPALSEGSGMIRCQHGLLPVPVPATSAIAAAYSLPLRILPIEGELVTPTGAATAAALCTGTSLPERFSIVKIGIGAGKRDYAVAGILRAMIISETSVSGSMSDTADTVLKLEANLDDTTGEALGFVMEKLFSAGALDVFYTPITMKKSRPAVMLSLLCPPALRREMEEIIFRHTTCIGLRFCLMQRTKLERDEQLVETPLGEARVKFCSFEGEVYAYPEHESVAALAEKTGLGYKEVYHMVKSFALESLLRSMEA